MEGAGSSCSFFRLVALQFLIERPQVLVTLNGD